MSFKNEEAMVEAIRSIGGGILLGLMFIATALADGPFQYIIGSFTLLAFIGGVTDDIKRKERERTRQAAIQ